MEKRIIIAVALSFAVLYIYQGMFMPKPVPKPPAKAVQTQQANGSAAQPAGTSQTPAGGQGANAAGSPAPLAQAGAVQTTAQQAGATVPAAEVLSGETEERDIVVDTDTIRAVFTNRGAVLKHWNLKRYKFENKEAVDLVAQRLPNAPRPFSIDTGDQAMDQRINNALFKVEGGGATTDSKTNRTQLSFEYRDAAGLGVRKSFTINHDRYTIEAGVSSLQGLQAGNLAFKMGAGLGDVEKTLASRYTKKPEALIFRGGKVERIDAKTVLTAPTYEGDIPWGGVDDHYFMLAAIINKPGAKFSYAPISTPNADGKTTTDYMEYSVKPPAGETSVKFFYGPKQFDLLQGIDQALVGAVDFGWWAFIAVPLLHMLNGINDYIHNYGWSIIILTLLINLVIFPLRHKSVVSMRKMQELQPEIKTIQERYSKLKASDPEKQKMNAELMELYKSRGVNPASGCFPMLLTMPVLFAFYNLLSAAIELRGAPFGLWIQDLSMQDPWYVTPVLMAGTMFWQQRMTPSTADPAQQKMFMFMPLIFGFMFLWAPSGLVIYWFVSNLAAIGQQLITNKIIGPPKPALARPPAEGKIKKVGGGKTNGAN